MIPTHQGDVQIIHILCVVSLASSNQGEAIQILAMLNGSAHPRPSTIYISPPQLH